MKHRKIILFIFKYLLTLLIAIFIALYAHYVLIDHISQHYTDLEYELVDKAWHLYESQRYMPSKFNLQLMRNKTQLPNGYWIPDIPYQVFYDTLCMQYK